MSTSSWLPWTFSRNQSPRGQRRKSASRRKKVRLFLEQLEDRALLTSYTAATVSDLITDINLSNKAGGSNTITLTASHYSLQAVIYSPGNVAAGLPVIAANDNLTIVGNGYSIGRSASPYRPFRLLAVAKGGSLTLENLTLGGGYLSWAGPWPTARPSGGGAAIFNQGALTLSGVTVENNQVVAQDASPAAGGAIWSSGSLTLENGTLLTHNTAAAGAGFLGQYGQEFPAGYAFGGAVYIAGGTANITNTTFTSNSAIGGEGTIDLPAGKPFGGAIYVAAGQVILTTDTVNNNSESSWSTTSSGPPSSCYGGGVYVAGGTVTLSNDTLQSNSLSSRGTSDSSYGGGLYVAGGTVTLTNDTVESNVATNYGYGGGIYIASGATVYIDAFTLAHVINNTASTDPNIDGTYIKT